MVQELTKAFQESLTLTKVMDPSASFKVLVDLYAALFKTPKVKKMVKQVGNIRLLAINSELNRALETSFEASVPRPQWRPGGSVGTRRF